MRKELKINPIYGDIIREIETNSICDEIKEELEEEPKKKKKKKKN